MLVSVVMPVFGRRKSLGIALESVLRQSGLGEEQIEIVVVDDASPVPVEVPSGGNNIRLLRLTENVGAAGARNAGIKASRGQFIAFLDSDDLWRSDKLLNQLALARKLEQDLDLASVAISCGFFMPNRLGRQLELRTPKPASRFADFVGGCWMCPGSTLLLHRSVFDRTGEFDERLRRLEDFEWMLRFASKGGQLFVSAYGGAVIAPSAGAKFEPVVNAIEIIRHEVDKLGSVEMSAGERRTMESYLELEMAAACLGGPRRLVAMYHLLRSLLLKPRLQMSTADFWVRSRKIPDDAFACYEKLTAPED